VRVLWMPRLGLSVHVGRLGSGISVWGRLRAAHERTGGQNEKTWLPSTVTLASNSILASRCYPPPQEWVVELGRR